MRKADNLPPYRAVVMKSVSLNILEPSGPAQACYGRTLLLLFMDLKSKIVTKQYGRQNEILNNLYACKNGSEVRYSPSASKSAKSNSI